MESFGSYLKRERELRGISLDEISSATKIRKSILAAIENDRVDELPPEVFVIGFIKAYARHIGLDPEDVITRYRGFQKLEEAKDEDIITVEKDFERKEPYYVVKFVVLALLVITGLGLLIYREIIRDDSGTVAKQPPPSSIIKEDILKSEVSTPEKPRTGDQPSVEKGKAKSEPLKLTIEAVEKAWVRVIVDDGTPADALLEPGDVIIKHAQKKFLLIIGNAGGVKISLNDILQPPAGKRGEIVRMSLPSKD